MLNDGWFIFVGATGECEGGCCGRNNRYIWV